MMQEISLNVLDVAENSVRANASLVEIEVKADTVADKLTVIIKDNGCGMTKEQIGNVEDPFFTTRTTRKVGLGVPFFKMAALAADGDFSIESKVGRGTIVRAEFKISHIDRMPLGDINSTIHTLIVYNDKMDFVYRYAFNDKSFVLDTREMREILGNVPFGASEVSNYIKEFLNENKSEVDGEKAIL